MHLKNFSLRFLQEKTGIAGPRLSRIFNGQGVGENTIRRMAGSLNMEPAEVYRQIEEIRREKKARKEAEANA